MLNDITDFIFEEALDALPDRDDKKRRKASLMDYVIGFAMLAVIVAIVLWVFY